MIQLALLKPQKLTLTLVLEGHLSTLRPEKKPEEPFKDNNNQQITNEKLLSYYKVKEQVFFCPENGESEPLKARRPSHGSQNLYEKNLYFEVIFFCWVDTKSKHGPFNSKTEAQIF